MGNSSKVNWRKPSEYYRPIEVERWRDGGR